MRYFGLHSSIIRLRAFSDSFIPFGTATPPEENTANIASSSNSLSSRTMSTRVPSRRPWETRVLPMTLTLEASCPYDHWPFSVMTAILPGCSVALLKSSEQTDAPA